MDEILEKTRYGSSQTSEAQGQFCSSSFMSMTADALVSVNRGLYAGFARKEMESWSASCKVETLLTLVSSSPISSHPYLDANSPSVTEPSGKNISP